jgi:hypothetical protein
LASGRGVPVTWPAGYTVSLVSASSATTVATYNVATLAWSSGIVFASGETIVLYSASATGAQGLFGDSLVAIGGNGYSGTVLSSTFS